MLHCHRIQIITQNFSKVGPEMNHQDRLELGQKCRSLARCRVTFLFLLSLLKVIFDGDLELAFPPPQTRRRSRSKKFPYKSNLEQAREGEKKKGNPKKGKESVCQVCSSGATWD